MVFRCLQFFEREKQYRTKILGNEPASRTAEALGLSRRTVFAVKKELSSAGASDLPGPGKQACGKRPKKIDDFLKGCIRREVHGFFHCKDFPTMEKVLEACKTNIKDFPDLSRTTMWRVLRAMGFRYKKRDGKRCVHERADVVRKRHEYLRTIRRLREEGRPIVYLDETWVNQHHTRSRSWGDESEGAAIPEPPSGKGKRLILLHAGCSKGFLPDCLLLFVGKKDTADYHSEMNAQHFEEWWECNLLPNLPAGAVIAMDNASYHTRKTAASQAPTNSTRKADMQAWLTEHNIVWTAGMLKKELYDLVRKHRPEPKYVADEMANSQGFLALRLPVAHCELNPIELIWAQIKREVAEKNITFRLQDVKALTGEAVAHVTPENWQKACSHVEKVEEEYWESDNIQDTMVEELIIHLGSDEDETDTESEDSEEYDES